MATAQTKAPHRTGSRQEWLTARLELLMAEKELTRRNDELARRTYRNPQTASHSDKSFAMMVALRAIAERFVRERRTQPKYAVPDPSRNVPSFAGPR